MRGDPVTALESLERGLEIQRQEGNRFLVADTLTGIAGTEVITGDLDAATEHYREALDLFLEAGNPISIGIIFLGTGVIATRQGRHERAARLWGAEARIHDEHGGGMPFRDQLWGSAEEETREALGQEAYERARAEGYAMSLDEAVAYTREA
jgi:tetratricopeptide (TPR) repeat protein